MTVLSWARLSDILQRERILVVEVRFRHVSSDWYLLQSAGDLAALERQLATPGPDTPVYAWAASQIRRTAKAAFRIPLPTALSEVRRLGERMDCLVLLEDIGGSERWWMVSYDDELEECISALAERSGTVAAWHEETIRNLKPELVGDAPALSY